MRQRQRVIVCVCVCFYSYLYVCKLQEREWVNRGEGGGEWKEIHIQDKGMKEKKIEQRENE